MNQVVRLRPAVAEDAAQLSEIALTAKAALGYSPQLIERWRAELSIDARIIHDHLVWVACRDDDGIAGFFSLILADGGARLDHLWVAPACQGAGYRRPADGQGLGAGHRPSRWCRQR